MIIDMEYIQISDWIGDITNWFRDISSNQTSQIITDVELIWTSFKICNTSPGTLPIFSNFTAKHPDE